MKTWCVLLVGAGLAAAQDGKPVAEVDLPRETQLELQVVAQQEKEIADRLNAVAQLLMAPMYATKADILRRACEKAGYPVLVAGKPACEIRAGKLVNTVAAAAGKEK